MCESGSNMALAFIEHLAGAGIARQIRGGIEIPDNGGSEEDPFAEFHGLVWRGLKWNVI